jgi:hypothetical protein
MGAPSQRRTLEYYELDTKLKSLIVRSAYKEKLNNHKFHATSITSLIRFISDFPSVSVLLWTQSILKESAHLDGIEQNGRIIGPNCNRSTIPVVTVHWPVSTRPASGTRSSGCKTELYKLSAVGPNSNSF